MKKIALEEHFTTKELLKECLRTDFSVMDPAHVANFCAGLVDFGDLRIKAMDEAGIDISVLSLTGPGIQGETYDVSTAIKLATDVNNYLAGEIAKRPTRYRGFAALPMHDPAAATRELERCVKELGFVGGLVNGQTDNHYLDEERYFPFWEKVQELDVPLYIHPGSPAVMPLNFSHHEVLAGALWGWTVETGTHVLRLITSGLFDRLPKLKIIVGHMGEALPFLKWRLDSRWDILKHAIPLQKKPSQYLTDNIYVTTSGMFANGPLLCSIAEMGEDNVLFSVDYPYESSKEAGEFMDKAPLSESVRKKVAYGNAERLLKIN